MMEFALDLEGPVAIKYPRGSALDIPGEVVPRIYYGKSSVVYDSDNPATNQKIANFDITAFGNKYYKTGNFFGEFNEDVISVVVPVVGEFKTDGYIILHVYERDLYPEYNHQLHIIYITLIVMLLFSLIILLIFNFVVYLPIKKISTAAHEYANGNFTYAGLSKFTSEDEIGRLGVSLNYMASKLNDMEEDQKKFVSNVSHDFRSPLTSIKGYIEAMKDGTIPYEMQPKYLVFAATWQSYMHSQGLILFSTAIMIYPN